MDLTVSWPVDTRRDWRKVHGHASWHLLTTKRLIIAPCQLLISLSPTDHLDGVGGPGLGWCSGRPGLHREINRKWRPTQSTLNTVRCCDWTPPPRLRFPARLAATIQRCQPADRPQPAPEPIPRSSHAPPSGLLGLVAVVVHAASAINVHGDDGADDADHLQGHAQVLEAIQPRRQ